jgi:hypothetical protein
MEAQRSRTSSNEVSARGIATINPPDLVNLDGCTEDARQAALDGDAGPEPPTRFFALRGRLEAVRKRFPPLYRDDFVTPYIHTLDELGEAGFNQVLMRDPTLEGSAGLLLDAAQAILQQGEGFAEQATDAFQEVVGDLYDGFLSAEDRRGVNPPDKGVIPPLVKWGNPDFGPYTWPVDATASLGVGAGVVSLPPANTRRGLLAWAALGHETAGHDIIGADTGLRDELATAIFTGVESLDANLAEYWSSRIDETASDVLGILNMGPVAGIGLIGYFRALNAAFGGESSLRSVGPANDPHPADIVRGYLACETIKLLRFTGKTHWAGAVFAEVEKDVGQIVLDGVEVDKAKAQRSAALVAKALVSFKAKSLEGHGLGEIQNWRDTDERRVLLVRRLLRTAASPPDFARAGVYAAHVVAAAVVEGLAVRTDVTSIFKRMLMLLKGMHDHNPAWGPLLVRHPGSLARHLAYLPSPVTNGASSARESDFRELSPPS